MRAVGYRGLEARKAMGVKSLRVCLLKNALSRSTHANKSQTTCVCVLAGSAGATHFAHAQQ